MYSLDINFLNDRPNFAKNSEKNVKVAIKTGNLAPVFIGVAIGVIFPAFVATGWWLLQAKNAELEQVIAQLEEESKSLDAQIGSINKIKEETNKVKAETQSLVAVFDQIRPWSAMLQDLRDRIPATVQIENVKQIAPAVAAEGQPPPNPAGGVEITGLARSFNDVNDFVLSLQQSRFFKASDVKIISTELVDAPVKNPGTQTGVVIKPPKVAKYTIQTTLSDIPASDLIRELEQKGTVGLVARIRSLQKTGVIQK